MNFTDSYYKLKKEVDVIIEDARNQSHFTEEYQEAMLYLEKKMSYLPIKMYDWETLGKDMLKTIKDNYKRPFFRGVVSDAFDQFKIVYGDLQTQKMFKKPQYVTKMFDEVNKGNRVRLLSAPEAALHLKELIQLIISTGIPQKELAGLTVMFGPFGSFPSNYRGTPMATCVYATFDGNKFTLNNVVRADANHPYNTYWSFSGAPRFGVNIYPNYDLVS